jgi:conjugal transfer/entry exclusion protein
VKGTLGQTENNLRTTEEQNTVYHNQLSKTLNNLGNAMNELQGVLKKVRLIDWLTDLFVDMSGAPSGQGL